MNPPDEDHWIMKVEQTLSDLDLEEKLPPFMMGK
jgi:hypothetical protein